MKKIACILGYILLVWSLTGCVIKPAYETPVPVDGTVSIPAGTALITFIDEQGASHTILPDGKKLKECQLCPPGREKDCATSEPGKYCKGLVDATVSTVTTTTRILSRKNPICWTEIEGGKTRQRCYCFPGDRHELCN